MTNRRMIHALLTAGALLFGPAGESLGAPVIDSITPPSGVAGSRATITGHGFAADNTISFGSTSIRHVGIASAAAIACTADPKCKPGIRQSLKFSVPWKARGGSYPVTVQNDSGASNAMNFTVTVK